MKATKFNISSNRVFRGGGQNDPPEVACKPHCIAFTSSVRYEYLSFRPVLCLSLHSEKR